METMSESAREGSLKPEKDKCLFDIYKKEGDDFYMRRKYKKAMDSYSLALTHKKHDLTVLVARSRCYLNMGLIKHALADAERVLDMDGSNSAALYQKAQVLYRLGHYESSLTFFNKGRKLNPSAPGFTEGVEKAEKAITATSVGRRTKTSSVGSMSLYIPRRPNFTRRYQLIRKASHSDKDSTDPSLAEPPVSPGFRTRQMCKLVTIELEKKPPATLDHFPANLHAVDRDRQGAGNHGKGNGGFMPPDPSAMHEVLSQLYTDKTYFEKILRDIHESSRFNEDVFHMAGDGLAFIAERMLFWADFGARAPRPTVHERRHKPRTNQGLMPYRSERPHLMSQGAASAVTSKPEGSVASFPTVDGDGVETWVQLNEVSEANLAEVEQEIDLKRRRKRGSRVQHGGSRASVAKKHRRRRRRRRRKKTTEGEGEEDEDLTALTPSEASKLQFTFNTARSGSRPRVPRMTLTTDTEDSGSEPEETEGEMTAGEETEKDEPFTDMDSEEEETAPEDTARSTMTLQDEQEVWLYKQLGFPEADTGSFTKTEDDPVKLYLIRATREIAQDFENEEYLLVRERVHSVLADLEKYKAEFMTDKMGLVATLHSLLGNAYLEVRDLDRSLRHHSEDLRIAEEMNYPNIRSRALGNIGRTHVFRKEYSKALACFARKSSQVNSPKEAAWLYHEIANCFLQLRHYEFARDSAAKALDAATDDNNSLYQLQAAVLLAVSEVKLKMYDKAHDHFTLALDQAKLRGDAKAESSIRSALKQVNEKMAAQIRDKLTPGRRDGSSTMETPSMHNSLADDWDSELAHLKDDESTLSEELRIITTAAALLNGTPFKYISRSPSGVARPRHSQQSQSLNTEQPSRIHTSEHSRKTGDSVTHSQISASSRSTGEKRRPSIIVPPPSKKRLQKEQELKALRQARASAIGQDLEEREEAGQSAEDEEDGKEEERGDDPTKEMAVRFRSFVSEIPSIGEEAQRERTTVSEAPKSDTVSENLEASAEEPAAPSEETSPKDEGKTQTVTEEPAEGKRTDDEEARQNAEEKEKLEEDERKKAEEARIEEENIKRGQELARLEEENKKKAEEEARKEEQKTAEEEAKIEEENIKRAEELARMEKENEQKEREEAKTEEQKKAEEEAKTEEQKRAEKEARIEEESIKKGQELARMEEENRRKAEEEAKKAEEEAKNAEEEATKAEEEAKIEEENIKRGQELAQMEEENKKKAEEEAKKAEEEAKKAEEEAKIEEENIKRGQELAQMEEEKKAEEAAKSEEENIQRAEELAKMEEENKKKAEEEAKMEEEKKKAEEEDAMKREVEMKAAEEMAKKEKEELEKAEEEKAKKEKEELEKKAEEEKARKEKEELERKQAEEEKAKKEKEELERKQAEEEKAKNEQEELERKKEEEEKARKEQEELERKKEEEEKARKEKEELEKKKAEEAKEKKEPPKPRVDPILRHLAVELAGIEEAFKAEDAEGVKAKAQAALESYSEEEVNSEKYQPLVAKLHSFLGSAALMLKDHEEALQHHLKDLSIGEKLGDSQIRARALENVGRSYVMKQDYEKGLDAYVKRLQIDRDDDSSARVFHEIANCFFHLRLYSHARDSARLAVQAAGRCENSLIQLQSSVLMAVCHVKEEQNDTAYSNFESALDFAILREDAEAEEAIREAMRSLRNRQVQLAAEKFKEGLKKKSDGDEEDDSQQTSQDANDADYDRYARGSGETSLLNGRRYDNFLDFGRLKRKSMADEESPYKVHFRRTSLKDVISRVQSMNLVTRRLSLKNAAPGKKASKKRDSYDEKSHAIAKTAAEGEGSDPKEEEEPQAEPVEEAAKPELHVVLPLMTQDGDETDGELETLRQQEEAAELPAIKETSSKENVLETEEDKDLKGTETEENDMNTQETNTTDLDKENSDKEATNDEDVQSSPSADQPPDVVEDEQNAGFTTVEAFEQPEKEEQRESSLGTVPKRLPSLVDDTTDAETEESAERKKKKRKNLKKRKDRGIQHRAMGHPYMMLPKIK